MNKDPLTISSILSEAGIRPSATRIAITDYVVNSQAHPSVDEIHRALASMYPSMSKTTVYNTMRRLVDSGAVVSLEIEPGNARYDGKTKFHAHFMCERCRKIVDVEQEKPTTDEQVGHIYHTQLIYRGICRECMSQPLQNATT
ncbi:MAG: transcriptional repressor [Bacteroides sp.]|nr:transcriptional repressor [Bacteroides sp.]